MNIFSPFKKKDELVLVFDIGSSSIGGSLFFMQSTGVPKIIYTIREPIVLEQEVKLDTYLENTIKSLNVVAGKISTKGLGAPKKIYCILAPLWITSETRIIRYKKDEPFIFNSKLANHLTDKKLVYLKRNVKIY